MSTPVGKPQYVKPTVTVVTERELVAKYATTAAFHVFMLRVQRQRVDSE